MAHKFFTRVFLLQSLAAHAAASAATYDINVFYSPPLTGGSEDCTSDPTATQTIGAGECDCLYSVGGCVASVKLGTNGGTGKDSTLTASFYGGNSCDGSSLGGDTKIECDKCHSIDVVAGSLAIQLSCPFSCGGLCLDIGIAAGVPCILFTIICSCCICGGGAAVAKGVTNKRATAAPMAVAYMQAPQGMVQPMQQQQNIYQQ